MINQEIPTNKTNDTTISLCLPLARYQSDLPKNYLSFSQQDFINWCSLLTIDQLETCFRVYNPEAATFFRKRSQHNNKKWILYFPESANFDASLKNLAINTYKKFIQALLFLSSKEYLDTITFNSDCFLFPDKVYKLLQNTKMIAQMLSLSQSPQQISENQQSDKFRNYEIEIYWQRNFQLLGRIVEKIQENLEDKMKLKIKYKNKNQKDYQNVLSEFNIYWKYCSQEEKQSVWFLGYNDVKRAACKLLDVQYKLDLYQIQQYVTLSQKIGAKQLTQRIFSWKLGRNDNGITDYMTLIFNELKKRAYKQSLIYSPKHNKVKRPKRRKLNNRLLRRSSLDESSNQTNETDIQIQYERPFEMDIDINQIIENRIEQNIIAFSDDINENANLYYQNRIHAYERLKCIMEMLNVKVKVYGSCCVGLAIEDSDVDVTVGEEVLQMYYGYLSDTLQRISAFFEYLECYLSNFPWISNLKVIKSATIPIIKFTIDTQIQYSNPYSSQFPQFLTSDLLKPSKVQIDLTIETTEQLRKHLGIVSTKQTQDWLNQIPTLQKIAIILKYQLALKKMNETYYGGLNTYTLMVLLVAVIRKEKLVEENRVCVVFERVLKFYSEEFQQQKYGIDLTNQQIFYIKQNQQNQQQLQPQQKLRQLQIRDPQSPQKIISRNCYQFKQIKKTLSQLHKKHISQSRKKIEQICSEWDPKQNKLDQQKLRDWVSKQMFNKYQEGEYGRRQMFKFE